MKGHRSKTGLLIKQRRLAQLLSGITVFISISYLGIRLWWVLAAGTVTGIIFGKVFCRWLCPIGFLMELVTGLSGSDSKFQQLYQYHKLGCPIAWISGILNKVSIFKVRLDKESCNNCGLCDKACYISTLDAEKFSLFKKDLQQPDKAFTCSKCLAFVEACPSGSLHYSTR